MRPDSVNVYMISGPQAVRLARLTSDQIEKGHATVPVICTFPNTTKPTKPKAAAKGKKREAGSDVEPKVRGGRKRKLSASQTKKIALRAKDGEDSGEDFDEALKDVYTDEESEADEMPMVKKGIRSARAASSRKAETVYLLSESE